jgi:cadmium resistance protein CadD (predicted permease)
MEHPLDLVVRAVVLFVSTDLDDLLVLLGFFSDPRFRARQIVAGQFVGIAALFAMSVVGSLLSLVLPPALLGFLGLVPIALGVKKAWELRTPPDPSTAASADHPFEQWGLSNVASVFVVTLANGSDNLSVYVPLFAVRSGLDIAIIGMVFAMMTAVWLAFAYWLTQHRATGAYVRRYARLLMPFVLIALGVLILQTGSVKLP